MKRGFFYGLILIGLIPGMLPAQADRPIFKVGSKKFTESVILGEIISQLAQANGYPSIHRQELGGTRVLWKALIHGDIDCYPEYTGTIHQEILADKYLPDRQTLLDTLKHIGLGLLPSLGFNNTYALGLKQRLADSLGVNTISDLKRYPDLVFGFTNEFMDRGDGWPGLKQTYQLPQTRVRGLDHDLAYHGLGSGDIDVIDMYSTDAEIQYYGLKSLKDDRHYFPEYQAVIIYRLDLVTTHPGLVSVLKGLSDKIDEQQMIAMNARVKLARIPEAMVAGDFLNNIFKIGRTNKIQSRWERIEQRTVEHLILVLIALGAAIILSLPLGIWSAYRPRLGQLILGVTGIIQTIPSLALLVFMIPLLGIGGPPAIFALFLYALLPIVRNTYAGLNEIEPGVRESALALGLSFFYRLRHIDLPLASRSILAGIKTSAIICIGTATLGALIGAGGYGQPILTGIRLDNIGLILEGAIPAALMALIAQALFEVAERWLVPKGLRIKQSD